MTRILIVEDNKNTCSYLSQGLREQGFLVDSAHDGQEGLFMASNHPYDLITLDVMLPQMDGWTVVKKLRAILAHTPILFLTAKDSIEDRVKGLELEADDYLVKPFAFSELLARIKTLLRRAQQPRETSTIQIEDLCVDRYKHKASRGSQGLNLTPKEFQLLLLLVERTGEVLSRTHIAEKVWDIHFDCDSNVIDVAIKRLRDKVDKGFDLKLIHAVRGVGYVLEKRHTLRT